MKGRQPNRWYRNLAYALALLGLGGCFSSSSDNDDSSNDPPPSVDIAGFSLDDATTGERELDPDDEQEADVLERARRVVSPDPDVVAASWQDGTIMIDTQQVDRPQTVTLELQSRAGNTVAFMDVFVANETGGAIEDEAQAWLDDEGEPLINLEETFGLYRTVALAGYVHGDMDGEQYTDLLERWDNPAETTTGEALADAIEDLDEIKTEYDAAEVGQSQLSEAASDVAMKANEHFQAHGKALVDDAFAATDLWSAPQGEIAFDETTGTVSRYIGNFQYGDHVDDDWAFDDQAAHLEAATGLSNLAMCRTEVY